MIRSIRRPAAVAVALVLALSACSSTSDGAVDDAGTTTEATAESTETTTGGASETTAEVTTEGDCDTVIGTFRAVTSANEDLPDPELDATCDGDDVVVASNGIPDYAYVETSPGEPTASDLEFRIPVTPTEASEPTDVALLGAIAVAVNGVPIYGPTEGTGGDVLSLEGALSDCGSHNGPTGFHMHLFGVAEGVDCLYSVDEVATGSAQVGWSPDGYPIMSGLVCTDDACSETEQLTSSWSLTDESLFATDTWSAHTFAEGSGDLDECNGRVDDDGQYRYYTTTTFPYVLGCYHGDVADDAFGGAAAAGTDGGPGGGGPPA